LLVWKGDLHSTSGTYTHAPPATYVYVKRWPAGDMMPGYVDVIPMAISPAQASSGLAESATDLFVASNIGGLHRSSDGKAFTRTAARLASPATVLAVAGTRLLANGGVLIASDDAGATFTPVPGFTRQPTAIAVSPSGQRVLVSEGTTGGLHRSDDGARTFAPVAGGSAGTQWVRGPSMPGSGAARLNVGRWGG
jgi:hypothetical protein